MTARIAHVHAMKLTNSKLNDSQSASFAPAMQTAAWQPITRACVQRRIWNQWGAVAAGSTVQQSPAAKIPAGQQSEVVPVKQGRFSGHLLD